MYMYKCLASAASPHVNCFSGSDGLLKLWTIKTSECVKTLDAHEARVWALAVNSDEQRMMSGAGDSSVVVWKVRVPV